MKYTLAQIVKQPAEFNFFRCNIMYYIITMEDGTEYSFYIPISDLGNSTLNRVEKGITLMRYIRKSIQSGELLENGKFVKNA